MIVFIAVYSEFLKGNLLDKDFSHACEDFSCGQLEGHEIFYKLKDACKDITDSKQLWSQPLNAVINLLHCTVAAIGVVANDRNEFKYFINSGGKDREIITLHGPLDEDIFGWVYSKGEAYLANNLLAEPLYLRSIDHAVGFTLNSMVSVPVFIGKEMVAVLSVFRDNDTFSGQELEWLRSFGEMLIPTFEKAAFFKEFQTGLTKFCKGIKSSIARERLSAMSLMAAGVAHEIQSPMAAVSGYVQLLKRKVSDEKLLEKLTKIESSVGSVNVIVNGLASFSRKTSPSWEDVDVNTIVEGAISRVPFSTTSGCLVHLARQYTNGLSPVEAYAEELTQVFVNILNNACQAMPDGGNILVSTGLEAAGSAEYNESVPRIKIVITDDGPGIPERSRKKVFHPFFSEGKLTGAGLGLSLCKSIMKRHRGDITFLCPQTGGTSFVVLLPVIRR